MKRLLLLIFGLTLAFVLPAQVVINEVYGGGGNTGATYTNDFIELYNNGDLPVDLTGWTVQYASSAGSSWQKTGLTGTIQPKNYYLIQQAKGAGGTTPLPTPDAIGNISMSGTAGKVALVNNSTTLTGTCPTGLVDFVGFGAATNCSEELPTANLSNTTSAQRSPVGKDTGNNKADFVIGAPSPMNGPDVNPPVIAGLFPANNATAFLPPFTAVLQLNEPVVAATGSFTLKESDGSVVYSFDMATVTIAGAQVRIDIPILELNKVYYFEVSPGAVTDGSGNPFAGISGPGIWQFDTNTIPGILDQLYAFDACSSALPDGFYQYSVLGDQKWGCTDYGFDPAGSSTSSAKYGVQINGYAGGVNNFNEDWLITPAFDLSGTLFPLLSFRSRTTFNGASLQLKVSVDYTGVGDPYAATWTDLNGKFPLMLSDVWTLSEGVSLSSFKQPKVYIAFVYNSSDEDGSRWTLDNIMVENSATPPPADLHVNTTSLRFPYVPAGDHAVETFVITGFDLVSDMVLHASGPFLLSKDGADFGASLTFTPVVANNLPQTIYVQFAPLENRKNYSGSVEITTGDAAAVVHLTGSSLSPETTLEVVNWNIEWFGSPANGPANDDLQQLNVLKIMNSIHADVYGLLEVVDESRLQAVVSQMPGYAYVISDYGSHTNLNEADASSLAAAQKLAFVYRTDMFSNVTTTALLSLGINTPEDLANPDYDNWASGRFPFMMSADVTQNCRTEQVKFILVHAKANTAPLATSYNRRKQGADNLYALLNTEYADDHIILLGDFNDDLDQSITTGFTTTSWSAFTGDTENFTALTLPLSLAGEKSTTSYSDVIDHVVVSHEMGLFNLEQTTDILTDAAALVSNYANTTTDHYPVFTRYMMPNTTAPEISCAGEVVFCKTEADQYQIPEVLATDDCGSPLTYSYVITGATSRSGLSADASGYFVPGTSTILWSVSDDWGNTSTCTTPVTVVHYPEVSIPDAFALPSGVEPNTVYPAYWPASAITLQPAADDDGTYTYEWLADGEVIGETASLTVSPLVPTTYTLQVTNFAGCVTTVSKEINVMDISGGKKGDKIVICHQNNPKSLTLVISPEDVADHLAHGDMLGSCTAESSVAETIKSAETAPGNTLPFQVGVFPNPSNSGFRVEIQRGNPDNPCKIRIFNVSGVILEEISDVLINGSLLIGESYQPGFYFLEVSQGVSRSLHKLIKQ